MLLCELNSLIGLHSLTIVTIIRMVYSVRIVEQGPNIAAIVIWTNVEVDVAIACGQ